MALLEVVGKSGAIPSEIQLYPYGRIEVEGDGYGILDDIGMAQIIGRFERRGNDVVIDYEHQTLKGIQAPAAGWITRLVNRGMQGLWAVVKWSATAKDYLKNREYRYFSPVYSIRKSDRRIIALHSVALTNAPKTNQLKPLVAKENYTTENRFAIDENQRKINKMLGVSDEDFLKHDTFSGFEVEEIHESEAGSKIAKMMGVSQEEIEKYGTDFFETDKGTGNDLEEAILLVAKMMDVTHDDLIKYGLCPSDNGLTETDADKIKRLLE